MEKANAHGMMVPIMRVSGKMEKETEQVFILKKMEFFLKDNGSMIKNMEKAIQFTKMVMKFLENGNMIDLMAWQKLKGKDILVSKM